MMCWSPLRRKEEEKHQVKHEVSKKVVRCVAREQHGEWLAHRVGVLEKMNMTICGIMLGFRQRKRTKRLIM